MKIIIFLCLISLSSFSQRAQLKKYSSALGIETKSNGRCKYTRNNLNKAHLNNIYGTNLNNSVSDTSENAIQRNFNCIFLKRNLRRDSNKIDIAPEKVLSGMTDIKDKTQKIEGKIRYLGLIPQRYKYTLNKRNSSTTIEIKIHFSKDKKFTQGQFNEALSAMDQKLREAEGKWKTGAGSAFNFSFKRVESKSEADYSVELKKEYSNGPYNKRWSNEWRSSYIAHELGHMMGLDDEYDNVLNNTIAGLNGLLVNKENQEALNRMVCKEYDTQSEVELFGYFRKLSFGADRARKCDHKSIMCDADVGVPLKWHIYTIFKRLYLKK